MNRTILVVDDEKNLRRLAADYLSNEGYQTVTASNGLAAQKILTEKRIHAVILDLKMPGLDGLSLLQWLMKEGPAIPALMISAFGEVEDAVGAMKLGASDYLVKPFDPEELVLKLAKALDTANLKRQHPPAGSVAFPPPAGAASSSALSQMENLIRKAAPTDTTILITGESGTGKEVTAQRIHSLSHRAEGPFIPINLGGLPENLVESELFGYEKGAFTGADRRKLGQFEAASGGTLFLDEIGEMPFPLQVKLLRDLQDRMIQRLGGNTFLPMDVRIIAATNRNLEEEVKAKRFREDLFYRLNVIHLELPPLRDRLEEIPPLAAHFIHTHSLRLNRPVDGLSFKAQARLLTYSFPGNIRELENLMERAVIITDGPWIEEKDLNLPDSSDVIPDSNSTVSNRSDAEAVGSIHSSSISLRELEKHAIREALLRNEGRREDTAHELGISRRTLLNKIKQYQLDSVPKNSAHQ